MSEAISPLASPFPALPAIAGVTPRVARAGYKDWGRCDLTYVELAEGTAVAGVFTRNVCCSTEVEMGREAVKAGRARALVVNAGNSNAFTGYRGREAVEQIMAQVSAHLGCGPSEVFVSSTGVIGVPLPKDKARAGVEAALAAAPCSWEEAARTIGTTDTFPKGALATAVVDGRTVTLGAIIKGSGMIAPDMATMLGYVFTDAAVEPAFLQQLLSAANGRTFSCITVDSDTSTSDTVLVFATGKAGNAPLASFDNAGADAFAAALEDVCRQLAHLVVRDGEGAQKFIAIEVTGAVSDDSARRIGLAVANSPLVKTAIAGEDANWGRVVMAVGKAGEPADRDTWRSASAANGGARRPAADSYDEAPIAAHLKGQEISIGVDLGLGQGRATVWTCDLTHGYISINADYRTLSEHAPAQRASPRADARGRDARHPAALAEARRARNSGQGGGRCRHHCRYRKRSDPRRGSGEAVARSRTIVGEEAAHADPALLDRLGDALCWIVDPLDGTNNFAKGKPPFGVLVALSEAGETVAGWIYDPLSGRFCHAARGEGAYVDGERIVARATGLEPPVAAISLIFADPARRAALTAHIAPHYRLVDIPRCAAEQWPRLALGVNDISVFERTHAWDHAAGVLLLNEAGGKAARPDGSPYRVGRGRADRAARRGDAATVG